MRIEVKKLNVQEYRGTELIFEYVTTGYYDLTVNGLSYTFEYKKFDKPVQKRFTDQIASDWLDAPILYGAYMGERQVGLLELNEETWNKRLRITNILVEQEYRSRGIGRILLEKAIEVAGEMQDRMVILETQSCNEAAIACYRKAGFQLIGFDTCCYSNDDLKKHEMRLEFGRRVQHEKAHSLFVWENSAEDKTD